MNPLVSPQWLYNRRNDSNIVIMDASLSPVGQTHRVSAHERYLANHVEGALFFDIELLSEQTTTLPHMLPTPSAFGHALSELGINHEMEIVLYEQEGIFSAPRAWWMLRTFGAKNVYLLDGGLKAWIKEGYPTQTGSIHRPSNIFQASLNSNSVKDFASLQKANEIGAQIIDARSSGRFYGTSPEPRPYLSSGHVPSAINIPFQELTKDDRFKSKPELIELFESKGVNLLQPIITMCGSGVTAAVIAIALEIVGAREVSLYDGSWTEYAQRPEAIIAKLK